MSEMCIATMASNSEVSAVSSLSEREDNSHGSDATAGLEATILRADAFMHFPFMELPVGESIQP
jgi:hypothetical protein